MGERRHFGEMFMLLPEHVPFRGLAQVSPWGFSGQRLFYLSDGKITPRIHLKYLIDSIFWGEIFLVVIGSNLSVSVT